jgi:galactokinase
MIADRFRERFGAAPTVVASAPGRVNLIGEHTDYNDGFVLPMAIDRRVVVAAAPNGGRTLIIEAAHDGDRYVDAVAQLMRMPPWNVPGANVLVAGDVPIGSGLSSSAALELAAARALAALGGIHWNAETMARLAQRAENEIIGVQCGIMDQLTAACAERDRTLLIDCRSLTRHASVFPATVSIVVMDTGLRRHLTASEYNDRRAACERAVSRIRVLDPSVRALRDVSAELLAAAKRLIAGSDFARASHVVAENTRPHALQRALGQADWTLAGTLMNDSHASLRDLYDVSSEHLDIICELARAHPACHGARLTGAGFGGCAIALVRADGAAEFIRDVQPQYEAQTYKKSEFFVARADSGARLES